MANSDSRTTQTYIAYSTAPETAMGTALLVSTGYTGLITRAALLPLPSNTKDDDTGVYGRGSNSNRATYQRSDLMNPIAFEITDRVNTDSFAQFMRRYMGQDLAVGNVTVVEASIAWLQKMYEQNPDTDARGYQPPTTSFVIRNNGADFLHKGCLGATVTVSQTGAGKPEYNMAFNNGGLSQRLREITAPAFGTLPVPPAQHYMHGADSRILYTDTSATRNLVIPDRRALSISFSANQNLDLSDTRMGMPSLDGAGCPTRGWYRDFLLFGDRAVSATFRIMLDDALREWNYTLTDEVITDFTWNMQGDCIPTSATGSRYGTKMVIPKSQFRDPSGAPDNNKAAHDIVVFPELHNVHYGVYRFEFTVPSSTPIS